MSHVPFWRQRTHLRWCEKKPRWPSAGTPVSEGEYHHFSTVAAEKWLARNGTADAVEAGIVVDAEQFAINRCKALAPANGIVEEALHGGHPRRPLTHGSRGDVVIAPRQWPGT